MADICDIILPMNRRNYQRELERLIAKNGEKRPKVLLHSCCGPCSSSVLEFLTQHFEVSILWYNPNVYPEAEFEKRLATQTEVLEKMGFADKVQLIPTAWSSEDYYSRVGGLEDQPEGGSRCGVCFRLRLEKCAQIAKEQGFDYFCTTLTVSRHKDAVLINAIGEDIAQSAGIPWLPSDFKKKDGENRSVELSEKLGIYRQLYCGCEFSYKHRIELGEQ